MWAINGMKCEIPRSVTNYKKYRIDLCYDTTSLSIYSLTGTYKVEYNLLNNPEFCYMENLAFDKISEKLRICLTWVLNDPTTLAWKANWCCYEERKWKIGENILFHSGRSEKMLVLKYKLVVLFYCKHLCPETNFACSQWKRTLPMCAGLTLEKCLERLESSRTKHFPLENGKLSKQSF